MSIGLGKGRKLPKTRRMLPSELCLRFLSCWETTFLGYTFIPINFGKRMEIVTLKQSSPPSNSVKANDEIPSALAADTKLLTKYTKTSSNKRGTERARCCRKVSGAVEFVVQGLSRNRRLTLKPFCFACQNFDMVLVGGESELRLDFR